jgi:DNA polymerase III subunit epsilon
MDSFIAIDYETANSDYRSACALGVSIVEKGKVVETFESFIQPPKEFSEFDPFNVMIHGITSNQVKGAPTFDSLWEKLDKFNSDYQVPFVCHFSGFDIRVTEALLKHYSVSFQEIKFYDTYTIARKLWPQLVNHKLNTLSENFKIELNHHNASSDAQACALIALKQIEDLGKNSLLEVAENYGYKLGVLDSTGVKTMSEFKNYGSTNYKTYDPKAASSKDVVPNRDVNLGSDLLGKSLVFTGELTSMSRKEAIQRAVNNGATVSSGVSKKTNYLVVGISDFIDFSSGKKTNKLKDAEALSASGQEISIIDEEDFLKMTT